MTSFAVRASAILAVMRFASSTHISAASVAALSANFPAASFAALAAPIAVGDAAGAWMLLVPAGKFSARDGRGPFDAGGRADMEAILARTRQYHGAVDILVDYDHQSVFGAKDGVGGTAKASGWIKELQVRDDGIYGRIEWTEAAATAIKAGEYRYLSPVIPHRKSDGRILMILNAALTNTPAVDLEAVAASAHFANLSGEGLPMEKILKALGLPAGSGEDAVLSAINALLATTTAIGKAAGLKDDAKPADVQAAAVAAFSDRTTLVTAAGLKPEADADAIVAALKAGVGEGKPDPTKFVPVEQVTALQAEVKSLRDGLTADKAEQAVLAAIKDGKLVPALKDWGLDLYKADPAKFATFIGSAPVLTEPQLKQVQRTGNEDPALDAAQAEAAAALGIDPAAYLKTLAAEAKEKEGR